MGRDLVQQRVKDETMTQVTIAITKGDNNNVTDLFFVCFIRIKPCILDIELIL